MADVPPEGESWRRLSENKELLSLILEMKKISTEPAARKMGVDQEQIRLWAAELEEEGWIVVEDRESDDQFYLLAEGAADRVRILKEDFVRAQMTKKDVKQAIARKKKKKKRGPPKAVKKLGSFIKRHRIDLAILAAIYGIIYFGQRFLENMNQEVNSFLIAVGLFVFVFFAYYKSERNILRRTAQTIVGQLKKNSQYYVIIFIMFTVVFYGGRLVAVEQFRTINLLVAVGSLAALPLIYLTRERSLGEKVRFIGGIVLFFYALALIFGVLSFSELILVGGERNRVMDVFTGFVLIVILQQMDYYLGLGGGTSLSALIGRRKTGDKPPQAKR